MCVWTVTYSLIHTDLLTVCVSAHMSIHSHMQEVRLRCLVSTWGWVRSQYLSTGCHNVVRVWGGGWRPRGQCSTFASLAPMCNLCVCTVVCLFYICSVSCWYRTSFKGLVHANHKTLIYKDRRKVFRQRKNLSGDVKAKQLVMYRPHPFLFLLMVVDQQFPLQSLSTEQTESEHLNKPSSPPGFKSAFSLHPPIFFILQLSVCCTNTRAEACTLQLHVPIIVMCGDLYARQHWRSCSPGYHTVTLNMSTPNECYAPVKDRSAQTWRGHRSQNNQISVIKRISSDLWSVRLQCDDRCIKQLWTCSLIRLIDVPAR